MKTRCEQVLERYLNGRKIAIWGNPTRALMRALKPYKFHIAEAVDAAKHFVVAVTENDCYDFQADDQSKTFRYFNDYIVFEDEGGETPFEWECHGVKIGRMTYFGEGIVGGCKNGYIESIGHFTSINGSADMGVNHQLDMIFTSDDIEEFFTDENKALFKSKLNASPKHPYNYNKNRITIGSDVYIGANAFINASSVTSIGHGAIIGSGTVVLDDVPPYAVVVGVPAKIKRYRFPPEMIETLLRIKWWEWSIEEINENAPTLMSPDIFFEKFGER
ncbi:MAG: CatB-related O-acetyltransferase [Defluviitaleaceae bacterium]|nr:CatB-related O-acetyltransferase [Defluviitaleaceae bacterium]